METRPVAVLTLRWIQWLLGAVSFGICLTYFLIDVNYYLYISTIFRAQVALSGIMHVYLYLAAIWISVKPQGPLAWAILDIVFAAIAVAAAGTGQPNISEFCRSSGETLYWSPSNFAYVPYSWLLTSEQSTDITETLSQSYLNMGCGFSSTVIAVNIILIILFSVTAFLQIKQHRQQRENRERYMTQEEKLLSRRTNWRQSLAAPFASRRMNLER